ncbi:MAG: ComEC/Rec2 family competence protein [Thermoleophilia bacterium]
MTRDYIDIFVLNVGAGSCAVIDHASGRRSMIDINNGGTLRAAERSALLAEGMVGRLMALEAALEDPIDWYRARFGDQLWRFILSHPDADHMSGIRCILNRQDLTASVFWDLPHTKATPSSFLNDAAKQDWAWYRAMRNDVQQPGVEWPQYLQPLRFASLHYWHEDGIEILSPSSALVDTCDEREDWNSMSYVLRVSFGGRSILLPGDVEQRGWDDLALACALNGVELRSDILVASHHGRRSGYPGNGVLEAIAPDAVLVSSDRLPAAEDAIPWYRQEVGSVFSTRTEGTMQVRFWSDGSMAIWNRDRAVIMDRRTLSARVFG